MSQIPQYFYLKAVVDEYPSIIPTNIVKTIGRSETCDVMVDNHFLSFIHSSIVLKDGDVHLIDLGSSNGTFVNNDKISKAMLREGDEVKFGSVRYVFHKVGTKEEKTPPPAPIESSASIEETPPNIPSSLVNETGASIDTPRVFEFPKDPNPSSEPTSVSVSEKMFDVTDASIRKPIFMDGGNTTVGHTNLMDAFNEVAIQREHEIQLKEKNDGQAILDLFPEFEFSEFIFEEDVHGKSLSFSNRKPAIETTVTFGNYIHDVDYTSSKYSLLSLTEDPNALSKGSKKKLSLPVAEIGLDKELVTIKKDKFYLNEYEDFEYQIYDSDGIVDKPFRLESSIEIRDDQVIKVNQGAMNLFIKKTDSPPKTIAPKWYEHDKFLYLLMLIFGMIWMALLGVSLYVGPIEPEKDDIVEEIDRILYREKVEPTTTTLKRIITTLPPTTSPPTTRPKPPPTTSPPTTMRRVQPKPVAPAPAPKAQSAPKIITPNEKTLVQKIDPTIDKQQSVKNNVSQAAKENKVVKVSQEAKLKLRNQGKLSSLKDKFSSILSDVSNDDDVGYDDVEKTNIAKTQIGNIAGAGQVGTVRANQQGIGKVGQAQGSFGKGSSISGSGSALGGNGISAIGGGSGTRTVLLGSIDPQVVRNILREHLPQFKFCYEQELERINQKVATTLDLKFVITGQGRVQNPNVKSQSFNLTSKGISCFNSVLSSIQFPEPKGGGIVNIRQPINMEP